MLRSMIVLLTLISIVGCDSSEDAEAVPQDLESREEEAAVDQTVAFPPADEFRLGEAVVFWEELGGGSDCNKLYLRESFVAVVNAFFHVGFQAIVLRCVGFDWANRSAPTAGELESPEGMDGMLDGYVLSEYDTLVVAEDGSVTFAAYEFPDRWSNFSVFEHRVAYFGYKNVRDTPEVGRELDAVAVIYDLGAGAVVEELSLGTCLLAPWASDNFYDPAVPVWAPDGSSVLFSPRSDRCNFGKVAVTTPG